MPDIIVTTPKSQMANAAREAEYARANPDSHYFRATSHINENIVEREYKSLPDEPDMPCSNDQKSP